MRDRVRAIRVTFSSAKMPPFIAAVHIQSGLERGCHLNERINDQGEVPCSSATCASRKPTAPRRQTYSATRLLAAGVGADSLYEDKASVKKDERPELAACLKALRHGDTLVVWKLDRLGRDLRHLVNIVHDLTERGVGLKVLTRTGRSHRYHHSVRQARLRDLRRLSRIRTRTHFRTDHGWPGLGTGAWPERRAPLQNDSCEVAPCHGLYG